MKEQKHKDLTTRTESDEWLLKVRSSFHKGNKNRGSKEESSDPVCISSDCVIGQICFTVSFMWQMVWQLIELINSFQLFNHSAIILLYFCLPNLKQIQPFVQIVSCACHASQHMGLSPSDCLSIPDSWRQQHAYVTSHICHGRICVSPQVNNMWWRHQVSLP